MKAVPRSWKMKPIDPTVPNRIAFLMTRKNPFHADAQKFFAVRAIYKYKNIRRWITQITYLDVCILSNKLDETFKAVK